MRARGFSLVEMVVILCIIAILLAMGTLKFSEYSRRHGTESQTRSLYMALLTAQANAVYQRRGTRVKLYRDSFEVYSTVSDGVSPIARERLTYPITWNQSGNNIDFDLRGVAPLKRSVCVDNPEGLGEVDSVVVAQTRVSLGKRETGELCNDDSISKR